MADLAMVFHWTPSDMDDMPLEELTEWRERARLRHEPTRTTPQR
ncbi:GpE family phage tail protein [Salinicola acroporae]|uniref:GpE family phage tail protein n=1 Tax=Salinicola acroporae TaxID=1541440 RepID=A0ABT6I0V4_9GAMM|nr:GpE family phage tail protein [Salinicola acroporae]MDH4571108.1 GpE family phage tail protein [Salinicola acroporae]